MNFRIAKACIALSGLLSCAPLAAAEVIVQFSGQTTQYDGGPLVSISGMVKYDDEALPIHPTLYPNWYQLTDASYEINGVPGAPYNPGYAVLLVSNAEPGGPYPDRLVFYLNGAYSLFLDDATATAISDTSPPSSFAYTSAFVDTWWEPTPVSVTFSRSAVPEPSTWGMMIAGLGMIGAAMRRNRAGARPSGAYA